LVFVVKGRTQDEGVRGYGAEEVMRDWRKLHSEELQDLYCSPNIIWAMKSTRMTWMGGTCGTNGGDECVENFDGENSRQESAWKS
jgi:hypothetical protein